MYYLMTWSIEDQNLDIKCSLRIAKYAIRLVFANILCVGFQIFVITVLLFFV